jgi:hypothetical protein
MVSIMNLATLYHVELYIWKTESKDRNLLANLSATV